MKILIDPGHGGKEEGAVGPTGLLEKDVNLKVSYYLKSLLEDAGYEVFLTRKGDETLPLKRRVEIAKEISPCLFISIHHNSNAERNGKINRFEVYVPFEYEGPAKSLGHKLAEIFSRERGQIPFGPMPARYTVLKSSYFSVLIEPGYIINPDEEKRLKDEEYLKNEATLIFKAINHVLKDGCNFRFKFKRHTPKEVIISRNGIKLAHVEVQIDERQWNAFEVTDTEIRIKYPASFKEITVKGIDKNGIEILPFTYRNPDFRKISSFSQRIREFGNLKLIELAFFDEIGKYAEKGLEVSIEAEHGEIIRHSGNIEDEGKIYILLKTDRPENNIKVSLRGFEAITNVHSIEELRANEIAGIVEDTYKHLEDVLVVSKDTYTITDKLGVYKIEVDGDVKFLKKGYFSYHLYNPEPGKNYNVRLEPIFPGLVRKKIILRSTKYNTSQDERAALFTGFISSYLKDAGATVKEIKTPFPGWDNEPYITKELIRFKGDISVKIVSKENNFILYYYYRDEDTLSILKKISSYFAKVGLPLPIIKESSEYFAIHPSGRRFIINIPFNLDTYTSHLYSYLITLGLEHHFSGSPLPLEKIEAEGEVVYTEDNLYKIPVIEKNVFVPLNLKKLKLFTGEQQCIHSPDGS